MRNMRSTSLMKVAAIVVLVAFLPSPLLFFATQPGTMSTAGSQTITAADVARAKEERDQRAVRQKSEATARLDKIMTGHAANRRPMELVAPFWKEGGGFVTTLAVNNTFTRPIEITPVVRRADGQEFQAKPFTVAAHESIDLALTDIAESVDGHGQIALRYIGEPLEVNAMVAITNPKQSLSVDYVLTDRAKVTGSEVHGVFYVPTASARPELVLSNTSAQPLVATLSVVVEDSATTTSREIQIGPYITTIVDLQPDFRSSLGRRPISARIALKHTGGPGDLLAHGTVMAPNGFSANMRFLESSGVYGETLYSPVLPLREAVRPVAVLGNTKDRSINVRIEASYILENEVVSTTLRSVSITPYGVLHVNLEGDLQALPVGAHSIGLTFHHYAEGGILTDVLLIDDSGSGVYQVSPKGYSAHQHTSHNFAFRLDGGVNTILTLANPSNTEEMTYVLHLRYEGKSYTHKDTKLKPGETRYVNIRELRDNQIPGQLGETMPRTIRSGQAVVHFRRPKDGGALAQANSGHAGHYPSSLGIVGIAGGTTYDEQGKMSFTTCPPDCGPEYYDGEVQNDVIEGIVGGYEQLVVILYDSEGSYQFAGPGDVIWMNDGSPITDVDGLTVSMLEDGFTTIGGQLSLYELYCTECGAECGDGPPFLDLYVTVFVYACDVWIEEETISPGDGSLPVRNPARIRVGFAPVFEVMRSASICPISWSIESGPGSIQGPTTNTLVTVNGNSVGTIVLRATTTGDFAQISVPVVNQINVDVRAWIVRDDNGQNAATTVQRVIDDINISNKIWVQCGVQFELVDMSFIDDSFGLNPGETTRDALRLEGNNTGAIEVYYADTFPDDAGLLGETLPTGIVLNDAANGRNAAHEFGHAMGISAHGTPNFHVMGQGLSTLKADIRISECNLLSTFSSI